ncbi:MAG: molybdopterin-dependent oxidoreductase [Acidobacteriota bacterium]|nr:molybdopterin-dependent oxidoreductase [Acidobacteriota bacterium]MDH3784123.1 molybdopterin-dependent oxidoreductase [Acidobacteriota bacterium]
MRTIRTHCNRDCPDACGIVATVDDGKIVKLAGDPDHPVTEGFLCYRTNKFLERQYDPDRITSPMLRNGETFVPISWDEALDRIASTMLKIREEDGGSAILNYRSGGSLGMMKLVSDHLFEQFGPVSIKSGDICSGAGDAAQLKDFGEEDSNDLFDLLNSKTIVIWGKNPFVSNVHLLPVLRRAKDRGARLIQIDPVHHRGADLASLYLQPRPGGDIALALGVMRHLFDHGGIDPEASQYCDHFEDLRESFSESTVEEWANLADVPVGQLVELATSYADGPSAILVGWGMQRRRNGSAAVRTLDALGAVSGNVGVSGGGVSFYFKRRGPFDTSFLKGEQVAPRQLLEPLLGQEILAADDPPIRMVWISNGNPVAMLPNSRVVAEALESREFTVLVDSFLTDTARHVDLVLPTTTMLEDDDIVGAYGHHWLGKVRPVVDPPDGVRTDFQISCALAERLGVVGYDTDSRSWQRRIMSRLADAGITLESLEEGPQRNPLAPTILFADRRFATPSGKVNLIHSFDSEGPRPTVDRPLLLAALADGKRQASQTPSRLQSGPDSVTVHPDMAAGFTAGERVIVESALGSLEAILKLDPRQRRDMALMTKGGWLHRGRCANVMVRARATDDGGGACYYDEPVRLLPL